MNKNVNWSLMIGIMVGLVFKIIICSWMYVKNSCNCKFLNDNN